MLRVWITSFVIVAVVVAGVLYFTREKEAPKQPDPAPRTTRHQTLTTNDVLKYIEVWPKVDAAQLQHIRSRDPNAMRDAVTEVLLLNSLSPQDWDSLWQRVEDAVNAIRAEKLNPKRLDKIDGILATKRAALASSDGQLKMQLESDIATLEAERDRKFLKIHPVDRDVIMRYWDQLNAMVPRLR